MPHEIVVVDDGSKDTTWQILTDLCERIPELHPVQNHRTRTASAAPSSAGSTP